MRRRRPARHRCQPSPPRWPRRSAPTAPPPIAVDAWGEPAAGCYVVWLELRGAAGDAPALADQVLGNLTGLAVEGVEPPSATETAGVLAFTFARPPYRGGLRARLGQGEIAATACFGNGREHVACDTTCARVLHDVR